MATLSHAHRGSGFIPRSEAREASPSLPNYPLEARLPVEWDTVSGSLYIALILIKIQEPAKGITRLPGIDTRYPHKITERCHPLLLMLWAHDLSALHSELYYGLLLLLAATAAATSYFYYYFYCHYYYHHHQQQGPGAVTAPEWPLLSQPAWAGPGGDMGEY